MFRDIGSGTTRVHFFDNVGVPSRVLDRIEERFSVHVRRKQQLAAAFDKPLDI